MLPRTKRIKKSLFPKKSLILIQGNFVRVAISKNNDRGPRFSVVVPKSTEKLAVARNKLKRRIYHILESYTDMIHTVSIVIHVKRNAVGVKEYDLGLEIKKLFKQSSLI